MPSKADASCAIAPHAPRLRVHRTGSREARRRGERECSAYKGRLDGAAPVAASGCLAPCGRSGQGSTYL